VAVAGDEMQLSYLEMEESMSRVTLEKKS